MPSLVHGALNVPTGSQSHTGGVGSPGGPGPPGQSAHEIWVDLGNVGDEEAFIEDLKGLSAYQLAVLTGAFVGTQAEWIASLKGLKGDTGNGVYETWLLSNPSGSHADFLTAMKIKGDQGDPGDSSYQLWLGLGNSGTLDDYLETYRGPGIADISIDEDGDVTVQLTDATTIAAGNAKGPAGNDGAVGPPGQSSAQIVSSYRLNLASSVTTAVFSTARPGGVYRMQVFLVSAPFIGASAFLTVSDSEVYDLILMVGRNSQQLLPVPDTDIVSAGEFGIGLDDGVVVVQQSEGTTQLAQVTVELLNQSTSISVSHLTVEPDTEALVLDYADLLPNAQYDLFAHVPGSTVMAAATIMTGSVVGTDPPVLVTHGEALGPSDVPMVGYLGLRQDTDGIWALHHEDGARRIDAHANPRTEI